MLSIHTHAAPNPQTSLLAGLRSLFDEDRFLLDHQQWNEALAERIARHEGVGPLDERHWRLVRYVRERFLALGGLPNMRRVCRATGMSREEIHRLFGGCLPIWRIAGLPNPGEEAKTYM
jgi:tRNA 2-thiouridine synthesizing protein E